MNKDRAAKVRGLIAKHDAEALHKALKGVGTDEKVLVEIFTTRPRKHLQEIKREFHSLYGKSLEAWIKGDCSGNLEKILVNLLEERTELKCKYLHNATAGVGTNEQVLIEILCPATDEELKKINHTYSRLYHTDLSSLMKTELSGDFKKLMLELVKADRPSELQQVDASAAKTDAETLYKEGEGRLGTNEDVLSHILTHRSKSQLAQICRNYEQLSGHTLEKGLRSETSSHFRKALLAIVMAEDEYYSHLFTQAIKGAGTNDEQLIQLMSTLTKHQLKRTNEAFTRKHQRTLAAAIKAETSGSYQKVLLGLLPPIV